MNVSNGHVHRFCELALEADGALHHVGRAQIGAEAIGGGNAGRKRVNRRDVGIKIRKIHDELLLIDTVELLGLQDIGVDEAIVKHSPARADDGLRRGAFAETPRYSHARS